VLPRVRAEEIERLVCNALGEGGRADSSDERIRVAQLIVRVVVHKDRVEIVKASAVEDEDDTLVVPAKLGHRNRAKVLDDGTARPDVTIVRAIARAHEWRGWLEQGEVHSYRDIASKADIDASYVQLVLPLAFLDPQITRELLDGRRQISGGLIELLRRGIPAGWQEQRVFFQA
jgi:ribosomal protein L18E